MFACISSGEHWCVVRKRERTTISISLRDQIVLQ
jgi:hypothetical protein